MKTPKTIKIGVADKSVSIRYTDNLNVELDHSVSIDLNAIPQALTDIITFAQAEINNNTSNSRDMVTYVNLIVSKDVFSISGTKLPQKMALISELSNVTEVTNSGNKTQQQVYDEFVSFMESHLGITLETFQGEIGKGKMTVNGTLYDANSTPSYESIYVASGGQGGSIFNATMLAADVLNS